MHQAGRTEPRISGEVMGKLKATIMDEPNPLDEIAAAEYAEWCEEQETEQVNAQLQEIYHESLSSN